MEENTKIALNKEEIKIERLNNQLNIKNTIIKHHNGDYGVIDSNAFNLANKRNFWITDNGVKFKIDSNEGIHFYHVYSLVEKGIILDYPLTGNFKLKFKLNYKIIVNFYLGTDHLINFRNHKHKKDYPLETNVWHDMEFIRKDGIVSIKSDGKLIRTVPSRQSLFVIRVYNDHREVNIKEFFATIEPVNDNPVTTSNEQLLEARIEYLEDYIKKLATNEEVLNLKKEQENHIKKLATNDEVSNLKKELEDYVKESSTGDEVSNLKKELVQYKNITEKTLDTYNYLFNNIYLDYDIKPKKLFNNLHLLILELMEFIRNVCEKHDLEFWLDYGNLLGAVRHEGFIPWDDDADIGMIREDFLKFEEIIQKEIDEHGLSKYVKIVYHPKKFEDNEVETFMAIRVYSEMKSFKGKRIISNIDVVPYDYMTEYEEKGFKKKTKETMHNLYRNKLNNVSKEEWIKQYYDEMNLSFEKSKYVIPGVDSVYLLRFVTETKNLFPLKEIKFEDRMFPCPNNPHLYLKSSYGDYMSIPKILHRHRRMAMIRYNVNNDEVFGKFIAMFKDVNENF